MSSNTRNSDGTLTEASCDYPFYKGETFLIFATKFNTKNENEYRTSDCLRTKKLSAADDDLEILGEGEKAVENTEESVNSLDEAVE